MLRILFSGVAAGTLIAIGGTVYLSCESKYIGAILFSIALLCICYKGFSLFTGKVGLMVSSHTKKDWSILLLGLLGNALATIILGVVISYALPALYEKSRDICALKLQQQLVQALIRSAFCGVLMYLAVSIYIQNKTIVGILFCVPVFILSGFEHSVANMFYFGVSRMLTIDSALYLLLIILGNTIGAILFAFVEKLAKEKTSNEQS